MSTPPGDDESELAWSQDDSNAPEPLPYSGADYAFNAGTGSRPVTRPERPTGVGHPVEPEPLAWYQRPVVLFGLAAALALAAAGGLAYTLTGSDNRTGVSTPGEPAPEDSGEPAAPPSTVTVTAPGGSTSISTLPPTSTTPTSTSDVATTTQPTTTTTQPTTASTAPPAASSTATTNPPPSSTAPPSTTAAPSTSAASVAPTGSR